MYELSDEARKSLLEVLKTFSPTEIRLATQEVQGKYIRSVETLKKLSDGRNSHPHSKETKALLSKYGKLQWAKLSQEERAVLNKKNSIANTGRTLSKEHRERIGEANRGRILSSESRKKISDSKKQNWEEYSPKEKKTLLENSFFSLDARKTSFNHTGQNYLQNQNLLHLVLEEYFPGTWIQNGGNKAGSQLVNGLEPDFIHSKFKKVIEYFEIYWHAPGSEEEETKSRRYKQAGYELLVIREEDLWADGKEFTMSRVRKFIKPDVEVKL